MNEIKITERTLNIEKIVRSKFKNMPRFIINYLKKILHEDDLNAAIFAMKQYEGIDFATATIKWFDCKVEIKHPERIPAKSRCLLASNHPLGGLDGVAIISETGKIRRDIIFPVNDFLLALPNLRSVFIPVNKVGGNAQNHSQLQDAFNSDNMLLYFPAGFVSRKISRKVITDLQWKKTFITKARETKRDIIPVFTDGQNSRFFYNFALWRKRLGIKVNIEMAYLVDEMYKQRGKTITLIVGKPIPYTVFDRRYKDNIWAAKVREHVYKLKDNPDAVFEV
ncbi:MAG: 1-acyl-sn-glycerol-3-phosphate acyltransferase [Bacteroidales bacterium]|jgi:putative hemolysin|nr:1-acyl-sn-glycerol-3-phosphate acyltransferase [Bacteroidales bacterium]